MPRSRPQPRIPWEDRFQRPDLKGLLSHLQKPHAALVLQARDELLALGALRDGIEWQGVPWRWSLAFLNCSPRPWAYIAPLADRPIIAIPLAADLVDSLPLRKVSRPVRDAVLLASRVGDGFWPQWDLTSRTQLDDILQIARCKHETSLSAAT